MVGSFVTVLIAVSIIDEDLLLGMDIGGLNALWYLGIFGVTLTICRSLIPQEHATFDPEKSMREVYEHIHYKPDRWRNKAHTPQVNREKANVIERTHLN